MMVRMLHMYIRFHRYTAVSYLLKAWGTEPQSTATVRGGSVRTMNCYITAMESGWDSCSKLPKTGQTVCHGKPVVGTDDGLLGQ
jgi:hypothetical protein